MPGRYSTPTYRYGFNGHEKDDEVKGGGNSLDFGARIHDPRLGRFLSVDPLQAKYASKTPYHFCSDNLTNRVDRNGKDDFIFHTITYATTYRINGKTEVTSRTVNSVEVIKTNTTNTYTAHNVIVTEDLSNNTTTATEVSKDVRGDAGKYLSEYWDAISEQYPQQISAQGENSGTKNYTDARARKNNYEFNKNETEINEASLAAMLSFIPFKEFLFAEEEIGIIYERIDKTGKISKPYVGQAKSMDRYIERQAEHARKYPDSDFEFKIIDKGKPGKELNIKEQMALDARGGPTNKTYPNGGTSNKKMVIKKQ